MIYFNNGYTQNYEIDDVNFIHIDKKSFDDGDLKDAVVISGLKYFKSSVLFQDVSNLTSFYFDNGFFDVIIKSETVFNNIDSTVIVNFLINENHRYSISDIKLTGLDRVTDSVHQIIDTMKLVKPKDYYSKSAMIDYSDGISDLLQNNGYLSAGVKRDSGMVLTKYDTSVSLTLNFINADTVFFFGKTSFVITDNKYNVSTDFLGKGITYREGEVYSRKKRQDSEKNMSQMPIVKAARIRVKSTNGNIVDFNVNTVFGNKIEITPFVEGTNISNYFFGGGGIRYYDKYFSKGGKTLTSEFRGLFNSIDVNLIELVTQLIVPYVINNKSSLSDKFSLGYYNYPGYTNYYLGNIASLRYYISDNTFYNKATIDLNEELARIKYSFGNLGTINLYTSFLSVTFIHDNTNNAIAPSRGYYHSITAGEGGLLPGIILNAVKSNFFVYSKFAKLSTSNRFYFNLANLEGENVIASKFILADNFEKESGNRVVPLQPQYKYYSGGSNSLRGWSANSNGFVKDTRFGGNFWIEGSVEFRKKLFPGSNNFKRNIGAVLFADFGNVWENHRDFRLNQIAIAIGTGIRYNIFIGPIRVDFGFKLFDPSADDSKKWLFQNNLKTIFKNKFVVNFGIGEAF